MTTPRHELWDRLSESDVLPFPLATETNYTQDGWRVNLIVVVDITAGGYEAITVSEYAEPYAHNTANGKPDMSPNAAATTRRRAVTAFAGGLQRAFAASPPPEPDHN
jgi:hypothetical protein